MKWWGILSGLIGLALVWFGRYSLFEKVCTALVALMFVSMVGAAVLTVPNLPDMMAGLVPTIPDGGILYVLSLAGGVGGTITLAAYGYWLREKGWTTPQFMRVMRIDNTVAYLVTGIFVVSTLIVGAELLYSANIAIAEGDKGLLSLADVLDDRYGDWAGKLFLVGFWAAAMSSLVGVWNGVSLMFADFVAHTRGQSSDDPDARMGGRYYRAYILWLTFPPMVMMFLGEPIALILAYGVLGAFFMPFLAVTLLWILNTDRTPAGVAQQDLVERRDGAVCAGVRRPGRQRDREAGPDALTDGQWQPRHGCLIPCTHSRWTGDGTRPSNASPSWRAIRAPRCGARRLVRGASAPRSWTPGSRLRSPPRRTPSSSRSLPIYPPRAPDTFPLSVPVRSWRGRRTRARSR